MKKIVYLLFMVSIMFAGIVSVYAALPYQENLQRVTLYTYDGEITTRKIIQNYTRMENVLKVISEKKETDKTVEKKEKLTNMEFLYTDGSVKKIVFYGNNIIGITENDQEVMYAVNYGSDIEKTIIDQFSDINVGNNNGNSQEDNVPSPSTGDNGLLIGGLLLVTGSIALVAYRKQKLS